MAITNHERVGKSLELLKAGLGPFVEREIISFPRSAWECSLGRSSGQCSLVTPERRGLLPRWSVGAR